MLQNYSTYRILRLFFEYPTKSFQLREISRLAKLGLPSVIIHAKRLEKEGLVKKEKGDIYNVYKASRNDKFIFYKKIDNLIHLQESGVVEFLADHLAPNAIVLFGSFSRGEDIERSDIDIAVVSKYMDLDMKKYEKILKKNIHLIYEPDLKKVSKEFMNTIVNGIVIYGYLKVF